MGEDKEQGSEPRCPRQRGRRGTESLRFVVLLDKAWAGRSGANRVTTRDPKLARRRWKGMKCRDKKQKGRTRGYRRGKGPTRFTRDDRDTVYRQGNSPKSLVLKCGVRTPGLFARTTR